MDDENKQLTEADDFFRAKVEIKDHLARAGHELEVARYKIHYLALSNPSVYMNTYRMIESLRRDAMAMWKRLNVFLNTGDPKALEE